MTIYFRALARSALPRAYRLLAFCCVGPSLFLPQPLGFFRGLGLDAISTTASGFGKGNISGDSSLPPFPLLSFLRVSIPILLGLTTIKVWSGTVSYSYSSSSCVDDSVIICWVYQSIILARTGGPKSVIFAIAETFSFVVSLLGRLGSAREQGD